MALEAGLQVDYISLAARASARWDTVLGMAAFEGAHISAGEQDPRLPRSVPLAEIRTPLLESGGEVCEVWRTSQQVESGQHSRVRYRRSEDVLFGCISLPEAEQDNADTSGLHAATEQAYREIFATLDVVGYPHLLRIWNYLPRINVDTHGTERYRQFNSGRREALIASGRDLAGGNVAAACALGSVNGSPLVIYFLAGRKTAVAIENPRQVSAYEYPPQYGPKPSFSRASLLREGPGSILFISGTASIVGHETVHVGDVAAQTRETLVNIEALLTEANRVSDGPRFAMQALAYKVYVRNSADLPLIRSQLHAALGPRAQVLYLQADICRQDLLVEVEATGMATRQESA